MKKLLDLYGWDIIMLGVLLALCMVLGCQEQQNTAWFFGDEEMASARLGYKLTEQNEVGVVAVLQPRGDENVDHYGLYGMHYFDTINVASPFELHGEVILGAVPYVGLQSVFDSAWDADVYTVTGLVFEKIFFIEHQYDAFNNQESWTLAGIRIEF